MNTDLYKEEKTCFADAWSSWICATISRSREST